MYRMVKYLMPPLVGVSIALALAAVSWAGSVKELWRFNGPEGKRPTGSLIFDTAGNLFGTTRRGGRYDQGTIFELSPTPGTKTGWALKVLHEFAGGTVDGCIPYGSLIFGTTGQLYGTASGCGRNGYGMVFELRPAAPAPRRTYAVLHNFRGKDGA
jgi:uncharacterized repeat protein (TIGR03803 family)